jgi:hypothetical protein
MDWTGPLPAAVSLVRARVPALTVTPPEKVLAVASVSFPLPDFTRLIAPVSEPGPENE